MRYLVIGFGAAIVAACATTDEPGQSQNGMAENQNANMTDYEPSESVDQAENAAWDGETMLGGYRFVDGLPPEGQYNAVADEDGTILRGVMVDSQGRICRRMRVTGSNIPELRCRTQEQWRAIREAGQRRIDHRQRTGYMFRGG